jgi:hypothetical protein
MVLCGCGSGSVPRAEGLVGDWQFMDATGMSGVGITLTANGTYVWSKFILTSANTSVAEVEKGKYNATDSSITIMPTERSCQGPDPTLTMSYSFSGTSLQIAVPGGLTLIPVTAPPGGALTTGCFDGGLFTPEALVPVTH